METDGQTAGAGGGDAAEPAPSAFDFWEGRYSSPGRVWSGRVNKVLADVAPTLTPGRSLDIACGEGADVVWLARQGWQATGVDISPSAVERAREAAQNAGVTGASFVAADLTQFDDPRRYDLVSSSFLHSPAELPREEILRKAATLVAAGGHLLIVSHVAAPPWASARMHKKRFPTPTEEVENLALDATKWETVLMENRQREATGPDGQVVTLEDNVVLLRRIAA